MGRIAEVSIREGLLFVTALQRGSWSGVYKLYGHKLLLHAMGPVFIVACIYEGFLLLNLDL